MCACVCLCVCVFVVVVLFSFAGLVGGGGGALTEEEEEKITSEMAVDGNKDKRVHLKTGLFVLIVTALIPLQ